MPHCSRRVAYYAGVVARVDVMAFAAFDGGSDRGYRGSFRRACRAGFKNASKSLFAGRRKLRLIALCYQAYSIQAGKAQRRHPAMIR